MPADHGLRLDDQQVVPPGWPDLAEPDQQQAIRVLESEVRVRPEGDLKLIAENEVLESNITAGTKSDKEAAKEQKDYLEHPAG